MGSKMYAIWKRIKAFKLHWKFLVIIYIRFLRLVLHLPATKHISRDAQLDVYFIYIGSSSNSGTMCEMETKKGVY